MAPVPGARLDLTGALGRVTLALDAADDQWMGANVFLLVDAAGNDTYLDDTAANLDVFHPLAAVVDLAGNDQYHPSFGLGSHRREVSAAALGLGDGAAGGGPLRRGGAARRRGRRFVPVPALLQGYGLFGVGALLDHGGDDTYKGYDYSQGAAEYGFGLLLDTGGGADKYETLQTSQGYGGTRGMGWLVDDAGTTTTSRSRTPSSTTGPTRTPTGRARRASASAIAPR